MHFPVSGVCFKVSLLYEPEILTYFRKSINLRAESRCNIKIILDYENLLS